MIFLHLYWNKRSNVVCPVRSRIDPESLERESRCIDWSILFYTVVACKIKMMAQLVEIYRLRSGNIIMRYLCNITRCEIRCAHFFQMLAEKGWSKQSYWVNLFHVSLVGRCTGDLIIALKTWKSQIFMICHLQISFCSNKIVNRIESWNQNHESNHEMSESY